VYEREILMTDAELELPHCLYERRGLDIADRSTELAIKVSKRKRVNTQTRTSTMQRSGSSQVSSTGILDTLSIQS